MKMEEKNMELTGSLLEEFEETKKVADSEIGVPYSTWSKACSAYMTIICC